MGDSARDTVTILPRASDIYIRVVVRVRPEDRDARAKICTRATNEPEGSKSRRRCRRRRGVNVNVREGALSIGMHSCSRRATVLRELYALSCLAGR